MVITDPIADMLMRIRNGGGANKETVLIPFSDMKFRIANVMQKSGYITHVSKKTLKGKTSMRVLEVGISYDAPRVPRLKGAVRVSRPSRRIYLGAKEIKPVLQGHGMTILSTPKGLLTNSEARKENVGGEVICKIW